MFNNIQQIAGGNMYNDLFKRDTSLRLKFLVLFLIPDEGFHREPIPFSARLSHL